jgi:processing peptidase subunit beta
MHLARPMKKAVAKTTKTQKQTTKKQLRSQTKRKFGSSAPTSDPRFSTINADVDRRAQARSMPATRLSKLENGLRVASEPQDGGLTTVCVSIDAGSRYETQENNGTAHFLEHTLFKGTSKRSRTELELEIEAMGGSLNAFTSREQTVFTATVQNRNMKHAMDLVADILQNSRVTDRAIENERGVIIEEMHMVQQDLQEVVYDRMHQSAYRGSSLAFDILGPLENIQRINKKNIDQYINTHYIAPRTVLSVVGGDFEHGEIVDLAQKHFGNMPTSPRNGIQPNKGVANFIGSDIRVRDDDMPRVNLAFGFETAGWNDADHYPLMALQMMLGSHHAQRSATDQYAASELVVNCAGNGWADSVQPFNTIYSDTGIFGLYAVAAPNVLDRLGDQMIRALVNHATHVPEQHLVEAKSKLKLSLLSQYEGTENTAQEIGRQLLSHGRRIHPGEVIARIDDIDQVAVQNVVKRFFLDQDFVVSAVGNVFELGDYAMLRKKSVVPWM